jgi:hypothetical protein
MSNLAEPAFYLSPFFKFFLPEPSGPTFCPINLVMRSDFVQIEAARQQHLKIVEVQYRVSR